MRILHLHEKFWPYIGGSTTRLLNLIKSSENKHTVLCRRYDKSLPHVGRVKRVSIIRFDNEWHLFVLVLIMLTKHTFNVIHVHNHRPAFLFLPFMLMNWLKVKNKFRVLLELHSIYYPSTNLKRKLSKATIKCYSNILLLSRSSVEMMSKYFQVNANSCYVIENGIDLKKFAQEERQKDTLLRISYIGSLQEFQGVDEFVKFANFTNKDDFLFSIFGGDCESLKPLKKLDVNGRIIMKEAVDSAFVPSIYSRTDVLLMTRPKMKSTDSAIPLKPIEALAAGVRVFSSEVGGMRELDEILGGNVIVFYSNFDDLEQKLVKFGRSYREPIDLSYFDQALKSQQLDKVYKCLR